MILKNLLRICVRNPCVFLPWILFFVRPILPRIGTQMSPHSMSHSVSYSAWNPHKLFHTADFKIWVILVTSRIPINYNAYYCILM